MGAKIAPFPDRPLPQQIFSDPAYFLRNGQIAFPEVVLDYPGEPFPGRFYFLPIQPDDKTGRSLFEELVLVNPNLDGRAFTRQLEGTEHGLVFCIELKFNHGSVPFEFVVEPQLDRRSRGTAFAELPNAAGFAGLAIWVSHALSLAQAGIDREWKRPMKKSESYDT